ncbi:hypothetical protein ALP64_200734 [Pseudomonas syringae pv. actinidiae]|uniref:Soluble lytic murein transglycosylase and related regulatory protein n=1 Tax=Pseudomonas syringae pv. actinidiae TaxID=103796 RepID=A0A2V0QBC9_PSESF|nr:hypothetical protein ALP64_200734 [Pseudomonas syringae pv. actinidiae]GBH07655.1 Soluble lytic murein transglycosylase and related regulatory protein [Pseudomonas syringae pv. actinidiae]
MCLVSIDWLLSGLITIMMPVMPRTKIHRVPRDERAGVLNNEPYNTQL